MWFNAPDTRFGWGSIITFSCFLLSIVVYHFKYLKHISFLAAKSSVFVLLILLSFKNSSNLSFKNFINPHIRPIDYKDIVKVNNFDDFEVYSSKNGQCYDFEKICVNKVKEEYKINKKFNYLVFFKGLN